MRYRRDGASDEPPSFRRAKITGLGTPLELEKKSQDYGKKFEAAMKRKEEEERRLLAQYETGRAGPFCRVLPWYKFCLVCGKIFWRKGPPNTWAKQKRCARCQNIEISAWRHCAYCRTKFLGESNKMSCGACTGVEHCLSYPIA